MSAPVFGKSSGSAMFSPGEYECARTSRYRVIVEREESSLLVKREDGKLVLPPDLQASPETKETRTLLTFEVESVDLAGLIAFLTKASK